jgi:hypothetical protein
MLTTLSRFLLSSMVALPFALAGCGGSTSSGGESGSAGGGTGGSGTGGSGTGGSGTGGSAGGCDFNGTHYPPGPVPSGDDCNSCFCSEDGSVGCTGAYCPEGCEYNGQIYNVGDSYPAGDGCNTCSCQADGQSICTKIACAPTCTYAGVVYQIGDEFASLDGCNKCSCTESGVSCTELPCACDPAKEWWRDYIGSSPQQCALIDFACPPNTIGFQNACGCGCEQDASCPQFIDCMPPAPNCEAMKEKCPYSGVAL